MSNKNRVEFTKRIESLAPTHDMKGLKDPATQQMKGSPPSPPSPLTLPFHGDHHHQSPSIIPSGRLEQFHHYLLSVGGPEPYPRRDPKDVVTLRERLCVPAAVSGVDHGAGEQCCQGAEEVCRGC